MRLPLPAPEVSYRSIALNYGLVVRPATKLDVPKDLIAKMLLNNGISAALGLVVILYAGHVLLIHE